jgi:hypothetical protein
MWYEQPSDKPDFNTGLILPEWLRATFWRTSSPSTTALLPTSGSTVSWAGPRASDWGIVPFLRIRWWLTTWRPGKDQEVLEREEGEWRRLRRWRPAQPDPVCERQLDGRTKQWQVFRNYIRKTESMKGCKKIGQFFYKEINLTLLSKRTKYWDTVSICLIVSACLKLSKISRLI